MNDAKKWKDRSDSAVITTDYMDSPRNGDVLKDGQSVNAARECQRLQNELHLQLFQPVDEDAEFNVRPNFIKINSNFSRIPLDLELVNVGEVPDDCTGDTIREAWMKVNRNFKRIMESCDRSE